MSDFVAPALSALVAAAHPGGGWGWHAGATPNTECTALAILTLDAWQQTSPELRPALGGGLDWLRTHQLGSGSWPLSDQVAGSSWTTSLAAYALADAAPELAKDGGRWLLQSRGRTPSLVERIRRRISSAKSVVDQDQGIAGWSWTEGTTGWVEPSSWALLALKRLRPLLPQRIAAERIEEGHALLADRMCRGGGWNYGNKAVLGVDLEPYPDTTALALIALQDHRSRASTEASITKLGELLHQVRSPLALALAVLALQLHGRAVAPEREQLRQLVPTLLDDFEVRTLALALLALDERRLPFRVG